MIRKSNTTFVVAGCLLWLVASSGASLNAAQLANRRSVAASQSRHSPPPAEHWSPVREPLIRLNSDSRAQVVRLGNQDSPSTNSSSSSARTHSPVLFWHGMGDSARGSIDVDRIALQRLFPGIQVYSVQIGKDQISDRFNSYIGNVSAQVDDVCKQVLADEHIVSVGRLNMLGFSQGCQFLRALIQRCPLGESGIRVSNFVSLGGQHQGVFGLPNCRASQHLCNYLRKAMLVAYEPQVQETVVQAQYWHDPLKESLYKKMSAFLADINNELHVKQHYKDALNALDNMVLVQFAQDEIVVPRETSHFGFYLGHNHTDKLSVVGLEQTDLYRNDQLGLKQMLADNKLKRILIDGNHLQYNMTWFVNDIAKVYLNN